MPQRMFYERKANGRGGSRGGRGALEQKTLIDPLALNLRSATRRAKTFRRRRRQIRGRELSGVSPLGRFGAADSRAFCRRLPTSSLGRRRTARLRILPRRPAVRADCSSVFLG